MNLILFHACLIFSLSHAEKINKKIARKNAYTDHQKIMIIRIAIIVNNNVSTLCGIGTIQ